MGRLALLVRRRCPGRHRLMPPFISCRGLLAGGPNPECTGGPPRLLRRESLVPLCGEGLRIYGHVDPAIPVWVRGGVSGLIEPVGGEWWLLLFL